MACQKCDSTLRPSLARQGPGHYSVHLGDLSLEVLRGGEKIDDCYEVNVDEGWALRYATPRRLCENQPPMRWFGYPNSHPEHHAEAFRDVASFQVRQVRPLPLRDTMGGLRR